MKKSILDYIGLGFAPVILQFVYIAPAGCFFAGLIYAILKKEVIDLKILLKSTLTFSVIPAVMFIMYYVSVSSGIPNPNPTSPIKIWQGGFILFSICLPILCIIKSAEFYITNLITFRLLKLFKNSSQV